MATDVFRLRRVLLAVLITTTLAAAAIGLLIGNPTGPSSRVTGGQLQAGDLAPTTTAPVKTYLSTPPNGEMPIHFGGATEGNPDKVDPVAAGR